MIIRSKTFTAWMKTNFDKGQLRDIADHGADAGWGRLTYYHHTTKLYDRFEDEIWDALVDDAQDFGHANVYEFMETWNKNYMPQSAAQFKNQLVWYMAERIARQLTED